VWIPGGGFVREKMVFFFFFPKKGGAGGGGSGTGQNKRGGGGAWVCKGGPSQNFVITWGAITKGVGGPFRGHQGGRPKKKKKKTHPPPPGACGGGGGARRPRWAFAAGGGGLRGKIPFYFTRGDRRARSRIWRSSEKTGGCPFHLDQSPPAGGFCPPGGRLKGGGGGGGGRWAGRVGGKRGRGFSPRRTGRRGFFSAANR